MTPDEIRDLANKIVDHPHFRRMIREVVLRVVVDQDELRKRGAVRAFLDGLEVKGVNVTLNEAGRLLFDKPNNIGPELLAVLTIYRQEITAHLERMKDLEERRNGNGHQAAGRLGRIGR